MLRRLFFACTAVLICVKAQPSRLKILPGLAFYRTDDGHDDSDNSLMDKDKDLLKSMWNIVDKMDGKKNVNTNSNGGGMDPQYGDDGGNGGHMSDGGQGGGYPDSGAGPGFQGPGSQYTEDGPRLRAPPIGKYSQDKPPLTQGHPSVVGPGGHRPPLGTPITTINVYSTYPGAPTMNGEKPFTATTTYHHLPFHGNNFGGATPFSANSDRNHNNNNRFSQNQIPNNAPSFDAPKGQRPFNTYVNSQNNPMPFEPLSPPSREENPMSQSQYDSMMNPNSGMGQMYDRQGDNADNGGRSMFNPNQGDEMGQGFGGSDMENPSGSAPLHFMMSHMNPNGPMRPMEELMNVDPLRSHMSY